MDFEQMYRDYIMSDRKCELLIDETGYVEYQILGDQLHIGAIYLKPEYRGRMVNDQAPFIALGLKVLTIAKERGCKHHFHRLLQSNPAKDRIMKYILHYGMRLSHNEGSMIVFYKEL